MSSDKDQLLRLYVAGARFNNSIKDNKETICLISVAKNSTHTIARPIVSSNIKWDEHFAIEYNEKDENSIIIIQICEAGHTIGECKIKLRDIEPPTKSNQDKDKNKEGMFVKQSWQETELKEFPLKDKKDAEIGIISIRIRREFKMFGTLVITVKDAQVTNSMGNIRSGKCILKLANQLQSTSIVNTLKSGNSIRFEWDSKPVEFKVDHTNHVFDVFIELWNDDDPTTTDTSVFVYDSKKDEKIAEKKPIHGTIIGQARLTLDDAKNNFDSQVLLIDQEHHQKIGFITVQAKLDQDLNS